MSVPRQYRTGLDTGSSIEDQPFYLTTDESWRQWLDVGNGLTTTASQRYHNALWRGSVPMPTFHTDPLAHPLNPDFEAIDAHFLPNPMHGLPEYGRDNNMMYRPEGFDVSDRGRGRGRRRRLGRRSRTGFPYPNSTIPRREFPQTGPYHTRAYRVRVCCHPSAGGFCWLMQLGSS